MADFASPINFTIHAGLPNELTNEERYATTKCAMIRIRGALSIQRKNKLAIGRADELIE
jgi:hypothetical protein